MRALHALTLFSLLACGSAHGHETEAAISHHDAPSQTWWAVGDATLAQLRGGFDLGSGLFVSFGISRAIYVNEQLVSATSLQINRLDQLTPEKLTQLAQQVNSQLQIVQNGQGNTIDASALKLPLGTYIQNTLDNQTLRTETLIQASSNSLSLIKDMNLHNTINEAVQQALGIGRP